MPIARFPDPRRSGPEGLVGVGGDLSPESLMLAYRSGIYPWPHPGYPLLWFCPDPRAILDLNELHTPKSLKRARNQATEANGWRFSFDEAFDEVIALCAKVPRAEQTGTWITPAMLKAYRAFHRKGHAHSVEVWRQDLLVGGVYGASVDGTFSGESMFHLEPNASKLAILHLADHLRSRGLDWMDIQMITPHMKALGAREIPRDEFLNRLQATQARGLVLFK